MAALAVELADRFDGERSSLAAQRPRHVPDAEKVSRPVGSIGHQPLDRAVPFDVALKGLGARGTRELGAIGELFVRILGHVRDVKRTGCAWHRSTSVLRGA